MRANANHLEAWKVLSVLVYRAFPVKRFALAVGLTLLAHGVVYETAPQTLAFLERSVKPIVPVEIVRRENLKNIPEELLPEKFRKKAQFVPTTPTAPVATPKDDSNFAAADQRAAQENPDLSSRSRTPTLDGELDGALAVDTDAVPRELLPPELRDIATKPLSPRDFREKKNNEKENFSEKTEPADSASALTIPLPKTDAGTLEVADKKTDSEPEKTVEESAIPDPSPRPQIAPPAGLKTITMRSNSATNEYGVLSLDAKFNEFGDYTQRMLEAIQAEWWKAIQRMEIVQPPATVVVEFTLNSDGTVENAHIVYSSATQVAALACLDAVSARAPFEIWRADMIVFVGGESDTTRISFHYR